MIYKTSKIGMNNLKHVSSSDLQKQTLNAIVIMHNSVDKIVININANL
jgi:hypothetical protein